MELKDGPGGSKRETNSPPRKANEAITPLRSPFKFGRGLSARLRCAFQTPGDRRVQFQAFGGDFVAAFDAVAKLAIVHTPECCVDLGDLQLSPFIASLGYCLAL